MADNDNAAKRPGTGESRASSAQGESLAPDVTSRPGPPEETDSSASDDEDDASEQKPSQKSRGKRPDTQELLADPKKDPMKDVGKPLGQLTFKIAIPDLRNGSLVNIQQAAPKAAMSVLYHWPVINHLPAVRSVDAVEHYIRAAYGQQIYALGGQVTDVQMTDLRKKAIVLGSVRAGAAAAYKLGAGDMVRSEVTSSGMALRGGRITQSEEGTTAGGRWTVAQSMAALDQIEEGVVASCVYMGMAVPVLQGVSLVMSGHHYIPTTYGLFKGIKKQMLGSTAVDVRAWVEGMGETFDDMAFHKACHTIDMGLKRRLSKSTDVANRLKASGHGAAAIRLPATPSEASGGKASIALLKYASATFTQMGHTVRWDTGESLMQRLEHADEGQQEADACDAVVSWVANNSHKLAFCAGIVQQVHDTTGTGRNTILAAYSVKRLIADNPASVAQGVVYARTAAAKLRASMEQGTFPDPMMIC